MSIMQTIFGSGQPQQQQPQQANPLATAANNPTVPAAAAASSSNATNVSDAASASPMDSFKDLWQPPAQDTNTPPAGLFNLDNAKLMEAVKTADFTKGIDAELMTKALSGDSQAFSQAMNSVAQQAFASSMMATSKMMEQALEKHSGNMRGELPNLVKRAQVSDNLSASPLFKHEATRPLLAALESQLTTKYPTASASQITELAKTYISEFANVAGSGKEPSVADTRQTRRDQEMDFSEF